MSDQNIQRAAQLMRLAAGVIRTTTAAEVTIDYDDTTCDGLCLADDLDGAADTIDPEGAMVTCSCGAEVDTTARGDCDACGASVLA